MHTPLDFTRSLSVVVGSRFPSLYSYFTLIIRTGCITHKLFVKC